MILDCCAASLSVVAESTHTASSFPNTLEGIYIIPRIFSLLSQKQTNTTDRSVPRRKAARTWRGFQRRAAQFASTIASSSARLQDQFYADDIRRSLSRACRRDVQSGRLSAENSICRETRRGTNRCISIDEIAGAPRVFPGEILASLFRNSRFEVSFVGIART